MMSLTLKGMKRRGYQSEWAQLPFSFIIPKSTHSATTADELQDEEEDDEVMQDDEDEEAALLELNVEDDQNPISQPPNIRMVKTRMFTSMRALKDWKTLGAKTGL